MMKDGLFRTNVILFETMRAELLPRSREVLDVVAGVLRDFPDVRMRVEGHADARGDATVNLDLSRRRAESVRSYLQNEGSIAPGRLEADGYGETRPLESGTSETALALNRRVEFHVLNPEALRRISGPATLSERNDP
jgi:outer membrane protein OmpA-like peptidoglycan-associated protein